MLTAEAITHENYEHLLKHHASEAPVVLQLGGSDPNLMQVAALRGERAGFNQININVGCPSSRVQSGSFGACLMASPDLVARIFKAMQDAVAVPVTIKNRIGIDDQDSYEGLDRFIGTLAEAGCKTFIVHARKAWLKGLSPKQNRDVPPLDYDRVYKLKLDYPELEIVINGGIKTVDDACEHLANIDGVMIGREAFTQPWLLADLERRMYEKRSVTVTRQQVQTRYAEYMKYELDEGASVHALVKPLSGLFHGLPGARNWRRLITGHAQGKSLDQAALIDMVATYSSD
jgi:tRNA-dihydrouridine synthase A